MQRSQRFGPFELNIENHLLLHEGVPVPLMPKVFDILVFLIKNRHRVVSRDELMEFLWPDRYVGEANITQHIAVLRKALGDERCEPHYIRTIPKHGYQFVAEVTTEDERLGAIATPSIEPPQPAEDLSIRSIAVLPFKLINVAPGEDYLALGLADILITRLSALSQITVRPTSAVRGYLNRGADLAEVGHALRVDAVLDGVIKGSADQVRVTVQLVRVKDAAMIWADQLDEMRADLLSLEDAIADHVTQTVWQKLAHEEKQRLSPRQSRNPAAFEAYLKGRYTWNRRTILSLKKSIEYFREAIEHDPTFALPYAGLADSYIVMSSYCTMLPKDVVPLGKAAALKALELDPTLTEPRVSLAHQKFSYEWDWEGADREFRASIKLNPGYASAHQWYSLYLAAMGRLPEAIAEAKQALQLDPLSLIINANLGWILYFARRYDEAVATLLKVVELDPSFWRSYLNLAWCYLIMGEPAAAIKVVEQARTADTHPILLTVLARACVQAGQVEKAQSLLAELTELARTRYVAPYLLVEPHLALGEIDRVFAFLEEAFQQRTWLITFLMVDPMYDSLRADPRYQALVAKLNLPESNQKR